MKNRRVVNTEGKEEGKKEEKWWYKEEPGEFLWFEYISPDKRKTI